MMTPASPAPPVLGPEHKSVPPRLWSLPADEAVRGGIRLDEFATPILALDGRALERNTRTMAVWHAQRGLRWAPHGKTSMSPWVWRRALDAGAWGLTVATAWQALAAQHYGVPRILIANEVTDPVGLEALTRMQVPVPFFVDSAEGVRAAARAASEADTRLHVLVDLGGTGGRAGVRGGDAAFALAETVAAEPALVLDGVGGYEGALAHDRTPASLDIVRDWTRELSTLYRRVRDHGLFADGARPVITASGSLYFDVVGAVLADLADEASVVLRPGAAQVHDAGVYLRNSPLAGSPQELESAIHVWARVLSRPEPGLAILDAGRRDVPYDQDLPVVDQIGGQPIDPLPVSAVDDQHSYVRAEGTALPLSVGDRVRLSLSHPCTAFDKWRLIPIVGDGSSPDTAVEGFAATVF